MFTNASKLVSRNTDKEYMCVYTVAKIYNDTTQIRLINTKAKSFIIFYDNNVFIDTKLATF